MCKKEEKIDVGREKKVLTLGFYESRVPRLKKGEESRFCEFFVNN